VCLASVLVRCRLDLASAHHLKRSFPSSWLNRILGLSRRLSGKLSRPLLSSSRGYSRLGCVMGFFSLQVARWFLDLLWLPRGGDLVPVAYVQRWLVRIFSLLHVQVLVGFVGVVFWNSAFLITFIRSMDVGTLFFIVPFSYKFFILNSPEDLGYSAHCSVRSYLWRWLSDFGMGSQPLAVSCPSIDSSIEAHLVTLVGGSLRHAHYRGTTFLVISGDSASWFATWGYPHTHIFELFDFYIQYCITDYINPMCWMCVVCKVRRHADLYWCFPSEYLDLFLNSIFIGIRVNTYELVSLFFWIFFFFFVTNVLPFVRSLSFFSSLCLRLSLTLLV